MPRTPRRRDSITDIPGIKVGHWTNSPAATGCTVILCEAGAIGGVDVRGAAPGTRETDLLRPGNLVESLHAVVLTGGSAFGLDAAGGVMRWCEEHGVGLRFGGNVIPIVAAAVLFDLGLGRDDVRPGAEAGYGAAAAARAVPPTEGNAGAGTGATVAKAAGPAGAIKGGIGSASEDCGNGVVVGAIVAVNAFGEIVDSATGRVIAAPRDGAGGYIDTIDILRARTVPAEPVNTTIGVVATNARLTKEQANRLATVAQDGIARAVRPAHTMADGDTIFAMATGDIALDHNGFRILEALAPLAVERAIVKAVRAAKTLAGVPSAADWHTSFASQSPRRRRGNPGPTQRR